MTSRRAALYGGLALIALGGAYLMFGSSDERRAMRVVRDMTSAIESLPGDTPATQSSRATKALREYATEDLVVVVTPELGELEGRPAVVHALSMLYGAQLQIALEDTSIRIGADGNARATLGTAISVRALGEERREQRTVQVLLEPDGGSYRIARVEVGSPSRAEPEARP